MASNKNKQIRELFPTLIYSSDLDSTFSGRLNRSLMSDLGRLEVLDAKGRKWSRENYRGGYTSYGSIDDLHWRASDVQSLMEKIFPHALKFAKELEWDLKRGKLELCTCWISRMPQSTYHTLHTHPRSVLSGTYYVQVPEGTSALKIEDTRMDRIMGAPPRISNPSEKNRYFLSLPPKEGRFYLFESWVRHEVPPNPVEGDRVSVSFNYTWIET